MRSTPPDVFRAQLKGKAILSFGLFEYSTIDFEAIE